MGVDARSGQEDVFGRKEGATAGREEEAPSVLAEGGPAGGLPCVA